MLARDCAPRKDSLAQAGPSVESELFSTARVETPKGPPQTPPQAFLGELSSLVGPCPGRSMSRTPVCPRPHVRPPASSPPWAELQLPSSASPCCLTGWGPHCSPHQAGLVWT